jgi:hypothetical protein
MKINISGRFLTSLSKLTTYDSWWYKMYSFFRWDLWAFIGNIWKFRRELYQHRWWDYNFTLQMLRRSVSIMEKGMHNGLEIRVSRDKKIKKMQRLIELLDNKIEDKYIELAEKELGNQLVFRGFQFEEINEIDTDGEKLYELIDDETEEENKLNKLIIDRSREIEETQWSEIWEILKGQSGEELSGQILDMAQEKSNELVDFEKNWDDVFDGTGLRGWWD